MTHSFPTRRSSDLLRGRQIYQRDRARRLPIARGREGKREILARLGRRAPFTRGGHEHLKRCLGIARERKREAAIGGGDHPGMIVQRRARGGTIALRGLRKRKAEGKLAGVRIARERNGKYLPTRSTKAAREVYLAEHRGLATH